MAFTHETAAQVTVSGRTVKGNVAVSSGNNRSIDESIPDSSTDLLVLETVDVSQLRAFIMVSDQPVTVETNDGTTPQETIILNANDPLIFRKGGNQREGADYPVIPFSADVTGFYITNASGAAAQLKMEILQDPTV
jgi:hypothetical protein